LSGKIAQGCLNQLFHRARTHNVWLDKGVPDGLLHELVDLLKLGPTSANSSPARVLFVKSRAAKERLKPFLSEGNRDKTMKAPVTAIIGYDLTFHHHLPKLFPHTNARSWFEGDDAKIFETAFRNGTLQGLPDHGGAGARPRLRADVRLRQCGRRSRVLLRHQHQVQLPVQSRLWRWRRAVPALAALRLRRDGANNLVLICASSFRKTGSHFSG
jgi:nitroreductase